MGKYTIEEIYADSLNMGTHGLCTDEMHIAADTLLEAMLKCLVDKYPEISHEDRHMVLELLDWFDKLPKWYS